MTSVDHGQTTCPTLPPGPGCISNPVLQEPQGFWRRRRTSRVQLPSVDTSTATISDRASERTAAPARVDHSEQTICSRTSQCNLKVWHKWDPPSERLLFLERLLQLGSDEYWMAKEGFWACSTFFGRASSRTAGSCETELQSCTFEAPALQKHHQNSTRRPSREEGKKMWLESEKKREILGPLPFGAPPFGATYFCAQCVSCLMPCRTPSVAHGVIHLRLLPALLTSPHWIGPLVRPMLASSQTFWLKPLLVQVAHCA